MTRKRLDLELVRRGLVSDRRAAEELIRAGRVIVAGRIAGKIETLVAPSESVAVEKGGGAYVSRGGQKLAAALDRFGIDPAGRLCLDAGSSTGGFTDVLLARGASRVVAVDVGYGQLAWKLRTDDRVVVMERRNIRDVRPGDLPGPPEIVTADLSFISLTGVIPVLVDLAGKGAALVLLVKPQFEAPAEDVARGGVVHDPEVWRSCLGSVAESSRRAGAAPISLVASPLPGPAGNVEFFLLARVGAQESPIDLDSAVDEGELLRPSEAS